jgi:predicted peptidase
MIKRKNLFIAVFFLIIGGGCLSSSTRPVLLTAIPVIAPTLSLPHPTVPATPTPRPTEPMPTETATTAPQPLSVQQPFSITLPVAQSEVAVNGLLYLPQDYGRDAQRQWPLIVFLHGAGERGDDPDSLASIGLPQILQERSDLPFVTVSPQLPPGEVWTDKGEMINALVDWLESEYAIDPQRIYLTGFSLGGFGTWALGLNSPDRFAALVPVAGGWELGSDAVPPNICALAAKPIWVFHGAQDETVKPAQSEVLVNALRACGGDVRYTLLPGATHAASGVLPYRDSELYDWLLQQALPEEIPVTATPYAAIDAGAPIGSVTPEISSTPLPGDGSLQPIGQHAYTIDLDVVNAKGITRTATISYLLYLPGGYRQDLAHQWPVVLYLHGSDVWGDQPEELIASGLPKVLASKPDFPAIVLAPQAPEDVVWWGAELDLVSALLDHVQATYPVDPKRIYLTGPSMGGFGAWAMALRSPQRFAAVVPIAGGWDSAHDIVPRNICAIKDVPIWVFHGAQDDIVLPKKSELMINALKQQCGVAVRYTLYPDANHRESFRLAYDDPELYAWLFEQHLP